MGVEAVEDVEGVVLDVEGVVPDADDGVIPAVDADMEGVLLAAVSLALEC